ncbi:phosphoesterase [Pandoraea pnomenusa 3kgm]|uniref:undecaprenyl-diphosphatase n=1 Tax=Pandoraea pnomenusa TaxID=93220 RepID=UPI0003C73E8F|nr:undecaprenyl-diphosphatase [Pandoraea pnomenusa]AHB05349.1 phosphoesterase [Pandoraea pnomenusa 3kgm]
MENLNDTLFLMLNAGATPAPWALAVATCLAQYLIVLVPIGLGAMWLHADASRRRALVTAAVAGAVGLAINQMIGWVWVHPRPFMVGLGHTYLLHAADSSFPSDHLTLIWSVAFALLLHRRTRAAGVAATLLGLPVAWARVFLGVHFPMDMAGSAIVAVISSWLVARRMPWLVAPTYWLAVGVHQKVFARWIARGWVRG